MKLHNNLFTVTDALRDESGFEYAIRLNSDDVIYKAHFPGEAITPGACIVQTALELYSLETRREVETVRLRNVKFISAVIPDSDAVYVYRYRNIVNDGSVVSMQVTVSSGESVCAKLSITCRQK